MNDRNRNIVIPLAALGAIVTLLVSSLGLATAWGRVGTQIAEQDRRISRLEQTFEQTSGLLHSIDVKVERISIVLDREQAKAGTTAGAKPANGG